jgi:hypothetical protein
MSKSNKTANYYFLKWADNDLPGPPFEVHLDLVSGQMPPTLQHFDAEPLLRKLKEAALEGRNLKENWRWKVMDEGSPSRGRCVHVSCPRSHASLESAERFYALFDNLGLSAIEVESGLVLFGPKLNRFVSGQYPGDDKYDIQADDLPFLIRRIDPSEPDAFGCIESRLSGFVQFLAFENRYVVEWGLEQQVRSKFEHFRAQNGPILHGDGSHSFFDQRQVKGLGSSPSSAPLNLGEAGGKMVRGRVSDLLAYEDALRIFEAFLRGEPMPTQYHWRKVTMQNSISPPELTTE